MDIFRLDLVSRKSLPVTSLFRIVKLADGSVQIETSLKLYGRGAYLLKDKETILIAKKKNLLAKALRCSIKEGIYDELLSLL